MKLRVASLAFFAIITFLTLDTAVASEREKNSSQIVQQSEVITFNDDERERESPRAKRIVEEFFAAIERQDLQTIDSLIADRGSLILPLSLDGSTTPRVFEGKPAILSFFQGIFSTFSQTNFGDVNITVGRGGKVVFAETQGDFLTRAINYRYENVYIVKFEIQNGKIVRGTEYNNPVAIINLQRALGQIPSN